MSIDNKITLRNVRLAFPALFEPKQVNGEGQPAYSASLLLSADDPQVNDLNTLIDQVGSAKWGTKAKTVLGALRGADKTALHNGDLKAEYDGFAGCWYVSARSKTKIMVADRDKSPLSAQDGKPYAGCFVDASIELWAQDNNFGKRVNATLRWVQFRRDGDAFAGSAPATDDELDDLSDADDDLV